MDWKATFRQLEKTGKISLLLKFLQLKAGRPTILTEKEHTEAYEIFRRIQQESRVSWQEINNRIYSYLFSPERNLSQELSRSIQSGETGEFLRLILAGTKMCEDIRYILAVGAKIINPPGQAIMDQHMLTCPECTRPGAFRDLLDVGPLDPSAETKAELEAVFGLIEWTDD